MLPTFIGIGAPKTATTWLADRLSEHPEVYVTPEKETHFFTWETIEGRLDTYASRFEGAEDANAVGEISVHYIDSGVAPRRIRRHLPNVRLFASLRNPIDQAYSYYWHFQRQNFHNSKPVDSFEEALEVYPERLIQPGLHHQNLTRWLEFFDRSQLLILFLDDIKSKPEEVLKRLYDHIGVDPGVRPARSDQQQSSRSGTSPRGPLVERVRQSLYTFLTQRVYDPLKRLVGVRRASQIKDALHVREVMERIFRRRGYPDMNPETRQKLRERFADDIRKLESLTGRDLSHWQ